MAVLVIDVTRSFAGNEERFVSALLELYAPLEPEVVVIGLEPQRFVLDALNKNVDFRVTSTGYEPQVRLEIAALVRERAARDPGERFLVSSHHRSVQAKEGELAPLASVFETVHPRDVLRRPPRAAEELIAELMPVREALEVLRTVLRQVDASNRPVMKTDIRSLLTRFDERFSRQRYPAARAPQLITHLLDAAVAEGVVRLIGNDPLVYVQLAEESRQGSNNHPAGTSETHSLVQCTVESKRSDFRPETRSQELQYALRVQDFGPHAEVREALYEAISRVTANSVEDASIKELVHAAVRVARDESPSHFPRKMGENLAKEKYPWRNLEGFIVRLLVRGGMIVDSDGKEMPEGPIWALRQGHLAPLPSDWPIRLDAELVLAIVRSRSDVSWQDGVDLAGALYLNRTEQYVERIDRIVELLFTRQQIDVAADMGYLRPVSSDGELDMRGTP
ncbi:hypothetical protein ACH4OW_15055 [Streptomyces sp. NPDC017056]|uniref:hypothetical protein n=1 Tax=Streptomyces sp. NPDC017056 TaxID=3364973 RepID=UPI0037AF3930